MIQKTSLALVIACAFSSSPAWSQSKAKSEEESIKTVIRNLWLNKGGPELPQLITFPYSQISVQDKNRTIAFSSKADMLEQIRVAQEANEKRAKLENQRAIGGPYPILPPISQISQLRITKVSTELAYVAYNLTRIPNPRYVDYGLKLKAKPPIALLTVLKKEQGAWKISFMTGP